MEGNSETDVRLAEPWDVLVTNGNIPNVEPTVAMDSMQTMEPWPEEEGPLDARGSGPQEPWMGVSNLGWLRWIYELSEWNNGQNLTQRLQRDQQLALRWVRRKAEAELSPPEALNHAEEQKVGIMLGRVAEGHTVKVSHTGMVHMGQEVDKCLRRPEACREQWKNKLPNIVMEKTVREGEETGTTLCLIMGGDEGIWRQEEETISSEPPVDRETQETREVMDSAEEDLKCMASNQLELRAKNSSMAESEGQTEEQMNSLDGTKQVSVIPGHQASGEALVQGELCPGSRTTCPREHLGLVQLPCQTASQGQLTCNTGTSLRKLASANQEQLTSDVDESLTVISFLNREEAINCCILEGGGRGKMVRAVKAQVPAQNGSMKSRLTASASDPQAKDTKPAGLFSDPRMVTSDGGYEGGACLREPRSLVAQLWRGRGELQASEDQELRLWNRSQLLEEEGRKPRRTGEIQAQREKAQWADLAQTTKQADPAQQAQTPQVPDKELSTFEEEHPQSVQQYEALVLQERVKYLQEGLKPAWREKANSASEEHDTGVDVTLALRVLFQWVKVLERSLWENVSIFTESEEAFKERFKSTKDLMEKAAIQAPAVSGQRLEERLRTLRQEVRCVRMEKESNERVWKDRLRHCQEQLRTKEEEMKRQNRYFEHLKLQQEQRLSLALEREQALQRRLYGLERELVDQTAMLLRRSSGEDAQLKDRIGSLQGELRELLGQEEAGQEERQALQERLQLAEDNGELLSRQLEDLRSRIQRLRLSQGGLLDQLEELAKENEWLRRGCHSPANDPVASGGRAAGLLVNCDSKVDDTPAGADLLQVKWEAALDPDRTKGIQTPSMTQCIQEAVTLAKLILELSGSQPCSSEWILQGSFLPLLENNSLTLAEIMQALRCGQSEQVHQNLQQLESHHRLLGSASDPASSQVPGLFDGSSKEPDCLSLCKEVTAIQSQPDLLKLLGNKVQNTNLISLATKTLNVDCNSEDSEAPECSFNLHTSGRFKSTNAEIKLLNETLLRLQAEIGSLRDNKEELEMLVRSKDEALLRLSEENAGFRQTGLQLCEDTEKFISEKDELHLETLKNNWRQENKVLGQRNEELLEQLVRLEDDHERELAQLRLWAASLKMDVTRLEEENMQHSCAAKEGQKAIVELQDALRVKSEEVGSLRQKREEDMALMAALRETLQEKAGKPVLQEDVMSQVSYRASVGNPKQAGGDDEKETHQTESRKALKMSLETQPLRDGNIKEVASSEGDSNALPRIRSTLTESTDLHEGRPPDSGITTEGIQLSAPKDPEGANGVVKQSIQSTSGVFRLSCEAQKPPECTKMGERELPPKSSISAKVTQKSHATVFSYKTVHLGMTLQERPSATEEVNKLKMELATTMADLKQSREYLDSAKTEAQKWYRELGLVESKREQAEKKASQALNELKRMRASLKESEEMKKENANLRDEVKELRRQVTQLEKDHTDAVSTRTRLEEKLVHLLTCLDAMSDTEDELRLGDYEGALVTWCSTVKKLKAQYDNIKYQFDELYKKKTQSDLDMAPLKAKLACVVQKCRERNSLIVQLLRTLRRYGCINCSLMREAEDLVNDTALQEYSSAFWPAAGVVQDDNREKLDVGGVNHMEDLWYNCQGTTAGKESPLSYRLCVAKADYCPCPDMPHTALPLEVQVSGKPDSRGLYHVEVKGEPGLVPACFLDEKEPSKQDGPATDGSVGWLPRRMGPERILELHQQLQQSYRSNYQDALRGLSDASGAERSTPSSHPRWVELRMKEQQEWCEFAAVPGSAVKDAGVVTKDTRPLGDDAHRAPSRACLPEPSTPSRSAWVDMASTLRAKLVPPAPTGALRVIKTVGRSSLLIGWERPPLDDLGCSNGTFVCGYRLYVNGEFHQSVMSSACTKAVLENLDLSMPVHISVQTLGSNGLLAAKVHVLFQGSCPPARSASSSRGSIHRWHSWTEVTSRTPPMRQSSSKSTIKPTLCVAIYNYSPLKDSPNIHPSRELAFHEGDTVWLFGEPRRDGFCEAEVNGTHGLAPVAFLEQISTRLLSEETAAGPPPVFPGTNMLQPSGSVPPRPSTAPPQRKVCPIRRL